MSLSVPAGLGRPETLSTYPPLSPFSLPLPLSSILLCSRTARSRIRRSFSTASGPKLLSLCRLPVPGQSRPNSNFGEPIPT